MFFNELDVLEIRMNHLNDIVDKFVLVEADKTFTGLDKPFYFEENKERYKQFLDKIIHIKVTDYPEKGDVSDYDRAWQIETHQRNCIMRGLRDAKEDDILIISDCDEIPSYNSLHTYKDGVKTCIQGSYCYYLNNLNVTSPTWMLGSTICNLKSLRNSAGSTQNHYALKFTKEGTPQFIRFFPGIYIYNAGWHFSWMGRANIIQQKIKSYSHSENNKKEYTSIKYIKQRINAGSDLFNNEFIYEPQPVTKDKFPDYLVENQEKYKHLILDWE